jgi:hypothetical protein
VFNLFKKSIKLCKDCKWMVKEKHDYLEEYSKCCNPKVCNLSKITGKVNLHICSVARDYDHRCGEKARYFEAKDLTNEDYYSER